MHVKLTSIRDNLLGTTLKCGSILNAQKCVMILEVSQTRPNKV